MQKRSLIKLSCLTFWLSLSSSVLTCRPSGATNQSQTQQITHFYTITSRSLPEHGCLQVSPVCLPLCANFRTIICHNKCLLSRVTFTLIVCTQKGSLPLHHGSKVFSIVSNFLFPILTTVLLFFLNLEQKEPGNSGLYIWHSCEESRRRFSWDCCETVGRWLMKGDERRS